MEQTPAREQRTLLDMNGYQWTVLFAAWLGWGFDVFDGPPSLSALTKLRIAVRALV